MATANKISGFVWNDADGDEILDDGPGMEIQGATVELTSVNDSISITALTDENGEYSFDVEDAGKYIIRIIEVPNVESPFFFDYFGATLDNASEVNANGIDTIIYDPNDGASIDAGVAPPPKILVQFPAWSGLMKTGMAPELPVTRRNPFWRELLSDFSMKTE